MDNAIKLVQLGLRDRGGVGVCRLLVNHATHQLYFLIGFSIVILALGIWSYFGGASCLTAFLAWCVVNLAATAISALWPATVTIDDNEIYLSNAFGKFKVREIRLASDTADRVVSVLNCRIENRTRFAPNILCIVSEFQSAAISNWNKTS